MFTLETVVPWGRSYEEYCAMFDLSARDLAGTILDCGGGPASFNAEATRRGTHVVSCDPLYRYEANDIRQRIETTSQQILDQTRQNQQEFVWSTIPSVDALGAIR